MDDLVEWLRVQLDDDERAARGAGGAQWVWRSGATNAEIIAPMSTDGLAVRIDAGTSDVRKHIALHDSARVLRDVEATRRLIQRYTLAVAATPSAVSSYVRGQDDGYREACLDAIRDAAAVFADRPGYRSEWAPADA